MTTKEKWADHPIYDCQASDQGRVHGITRILSPWSLGVGYQYIKARPREGGKYRVVPVHRLVLETFTCLCPKGHDPDHRNKNIKDNRLVNLRWLTIKRNRSSCLGKRPGNARLKDGEVWLIRKLLKHVSPGTNRYKSFSQRTIAKMFNVLPITISEIKCGVRYVRVK